MDRPDVVPLRLRYDKTCSLMRRFSKLPKWTQELIRQDMEAAFQNRIKTMERITQRDI